MNVVQAIQAVRYVELPDATCYCARFCRGKEL